MQKGVQVRSDSEKEKLTIQSVQSLLKAIHKGMENHQVLIMQKTKIHQAHVLHLASSYLHVRRQRIPSLGSRRVSKQILGNPRLGYTGKRGTQLITWVSSKRHFIPIVSPLRVTGTTTSKVWTTVPLTLKASYTWTQVILSMTRLTMGTSVTCRVSISNRLSKITYWKEVSVTP